MADALLTYGKFQDQYVSTVPSWYLRCLITNRYTDAHIKKAATQEWDYRTRMGKHWLLPKFKKCS